LGSEFEYYAAAKSPLGDLGVKKRNFIANFKLIFIL
jgi:hypothetical protein